MLAASTSCAAPRIQSTFGFGPAIFEAMTRSSRRPRAFSQLPMKRSVAPCV
jgi:hypothetical protein